MYILGVGQPLESFRGTVIGGIRRRDDNEDKLVAAPAGMVFSGEDIREATWFVEQYFDSAFFSIYDSGEDRL